MRRQFRHLIQVVLDLVLGGDRTGGLAISAVTAEEVGPLELSEIPGRLAKSIVVFDRPCERAVGIVVFLPPPKSK